MIVMVKWPHADQNNSIAGIWTTLDVAQAMVYRYLTSEASPPLYG